MEKERERERERGRDSFWILYTSYLLSIGKIKRGKEEERERKERGKREERERKERGKRVERERKRERDTNNK